MNIPAQQVDPRDAAFVIPKAETPWREPLWAALPHLWVGTTVMLSKLWAVSSFGSEDNPFNMVGMLSLAAFGVAVLAVLFYGWRRDWPLWTASWYGYAAWMLVVLVGLAAVRLGEDSWVFNMLLIFGVLVGLTVGYLFLFRRSRLHALLVALFLMPVLTLFGIEAIPDGIEAFLSFYFGLLAALAAFAAVRWWSWPAGVTVAIGVNLIAGATLTYVAFYQTEITNFYGDSLGDLLIYFGIYLVIVLFLFLGPLVFWRIWDRISRSRGAKAESA
ncbi:MAG: hypothetical protein ACWGO1_15210 [Anaerolineales bacterium]